MSEASTGATETAPVCPLHPDRVTRISCTRCGRPVCYECMVEAPVGFQCRECVAAASKIAPVVQGREAIAQSPMARGRQITPYVTYGLVAICVVVFLLGLAVGLDSSAAQYGMRPAYIALDNQWYRLGTSAFLHWSILHIGFNMLVLIMLGPALERILGHFRFTILYLMAALGGSVVSYMFSPVATASVGASGAVFGLMGALIVAGRRHKFDVTQVIVLLGINLVIGFIPGGNTDWRAHLGGLITGALVAAIFVYAHGGNKLLQAAGCLAIVLVLSACVAWRTAQIQSDFAPLVQTPGVVADDQSGTLIPGQVNDRSHSRGEENEA